MTEFDPDQMLAADLARLGPSEWAFDVLLKIAAFGFHDSNRNALREATKAAQRQFREAAGTCLSCGHQAHLSADADVYSRGCPECAQIVAQQICGARRQADGGVDYRR